jgi:hypothetical protein
MKMIMMMKMMIVMMTIAAARRAALKTTNRRRMTQKDRRRLDEVQREAALQALTSYRLLSTELAVAAASLFRKSDA